MNELSRHIERLLLSHDCVVVPQFGGFVTMGTSAQREEAEQLFFPPIRIVRFNPDLTEDDGLLTSTVRELHHCSTSEAKRHILRLVLNLRQQLLSDGQMDFGSIGVFQQDEDGRVSFSPCQAGVTTPWLFGLDAFPMSKLTVAQRNEHRKDPLRGGASRDQRDSQTITLHISKRGLKNTIAAAAIIVLCALFSSPFNESSQTSNQASILPPESAVVATPPSTPSSSSSPSLPSSSSSSLSTSSSSSPSTSSPSSSSLSTPSSSSPSPPSALAPSALHNIPVLGGSSVEPSSSSPPTTAPASPQASPAPESTPAGNFCIVLASHVSMKNANNFVKTLRERGLTKARVFNNGRVNRVIIDGFDTEAEAVANNVELHHANREYASSWVMAL